MAHPKSRIFVEGAGALPAMSARGKIAVPRPPSARISARAASGFFEEARLSTRAKRISPVVALAILDTLRVRDRPEQLLRQEDPSITLPRRLGLSSVVSSQIGRYEMAVRGREQVREDEVASLITLILRRDDADLVMQGVGERLARTSVGGMGWRRAFPGRLRRWAAQRKVRRALNDLFPGLRGRSDRGRLVLQGHDHFLVRADPKGGACEIVAGFTAAGLRSLVGEDFRVEHSHCLGRGDAECRWEAGGRIPQRLASELDSHEPDGQASQDTNARDEQERRRA